MKQNENAARAILYMRWNRICSTLAKPTLFFHNFFPFFIHSLIPLSNNWVDRFLPVEAAALFLFFYTPAAVEISPGFGISIL